MGTTKMIDLLDKAGLSGIYPNTWDDFIGQEQAKRQLRIAAGAALKRGEPMPHVLLASGVPGIGKTSLALLCAAELGAGVRVVSGRITDKEAVKLLSEMREGDLLVIDEIHRLVNGGKRYVEWLLHLLTDGVILGPNGPVLERRVTVVGTTTDAGLLPDTILDRFPIKPVLVPYTEDQALLIGARTALQILFAPLPFPKAANFRKIARAANRNPRLIKAILENIRDIALVDEKAIWNGEEYDLTEPLAWLGLTPDGLTPIACRYLTTLLHEFDGEAGERSMEDRLQEPGGLHSTERLLMDKGLLTKTRSGRALTDAGRRRATELTT